MPVPALPIFGLLAIMAFVVTSTRRTAIAASKNPTADYVVVDPSRVSKSSARPTIEQLASIDAGSLVDAFMAHVTAAGEPTQVIVGRLRVMQVQVLPPRIIAAFDSVVETSPISFTPGTRTPMPGAIFALLPTDVFFVVPKTEVST